MTLHLPKRVLLRNGQEALIRTLKESDLEPWCAMINACSEDTLWRRFERRSKDAILAEAARFCSPNAQEFVLVAEIQGQMAGEARLCLIPNAQAAEFCVLVADPWQGVGLGSLLTDMALAWADEHGIKRILVEVVPENLRILHILRERGFRFREGAGRILWGERLNPRA